MEKNLVIDKVVFFDGVCGLCNGFVDFVIKHDSKKSFHFSPLQSDYAKQMLSTELTNDLKTVVVQIEGKIYKKSEAVFEVLKNLGAPWSMAVMLQILPSSLLNWAYDLIASNRYRLFGKKSTCRIPTPEERERFIL
jgi:predicted DCC family thiol-disulfide oxidoreductase YuxK